MTATVTAMIATTSPGPGRGWSFSPTLATALAMTALLAASSGCATITRGKAETFEIRSTPAGATASLSNGERCTTPCRMDLRRKFPFNVELCLTGYAPQTAEVTSVLGNEGKARLASNILMPATVVAAGVDVGNGSARDLTPNPLDVALESAEPGCSAPQFPTVPEGGQTAAEFKAAPKPKARRPKKKPAAKSP